MFKSQLKNKLIFKKFRLGELIYNSNLSSIYEGINEINKEQVAIKFEKIIGKYDFIESEAYLLQLLKGKGIPKLISYGKSGKYKVLIEELLGESIYLIWDLKYKEIKNMMNDICLIALQCLDRLEYIHSKDIVHKDIKPFNFLFGKKDPELIYLIDFGMSKKYRSSKTGKHIKFNRLKSLAGSFRYMSINGIKGYEQSRRDDLESLGYVLVYLFKKSLPWLGVEKMDLTKLEMIKKLIKVKSNTLPEEICQGLPEEFLEYVKYTRNLSFEQDPNYDYLRQLFLDVILKNEKLPDYTYIDLVKFSWIREKEMKLKLMSSSNRRYILSSGNLYNIFSKQKNDAHKKLYKQIKDSINKSRSQEKHKINNKNNDFFKFDLKDANIILNNINKISNEKNYKIKNEETNKNIYQKTEVNKNNPFIINNTSKKKYVKKVYPLNKEKREYSYSLKDKDTKYDKILKERGIKLNQIDKKIYHKKINTNMKELNPININNFNLSLNFTINLDYFLNTKAKRYYKTLKEREEDKIHIN